MDTVGDQASFPKKLLSNLKAEKQEERMKAAVLFIKERSSLVLCNCSMVPL